MIDLKKVLFYKKEIRQFIAEYIRKIDTFDSHVYGHEYCGGKQETPIKNTDLWIEAYIELFPGLSEFRKHVRSEMKRLLIEPYPDYIYAPESNHLIYTNKRQIDKLRDALK